MTKVDVPNSMRAIDLLKTNYKSTPKNDALSYFLNNQFIKLNYEEVYKAVHVISAKLYPIISKLNLSKDDMVCHLGNGFLTLNKLALINLNVTPFFLSTRNSTEISLKLIEKCNAKAFICDPSYKELITEVKEKLNIKVIEEVQENAQHLISKYNIRCKTEINFNLSNNQNYERTSFYLHSSGTTSLPKIIPITNKGILTDTDKFFCNVEPANYRQRSIMLLPVYHVYGITSLFSTISRGYYICFTEDPNNIKQITKLIKEERFLLLAGSPYSLQKIHEFCQDNEDRSGWEIIKSLDYLEYGGAILPDYLGEAFTSKGVSLVTCYGSTEVGFIGRSRVCKNNKDYKLLHLFENVKYRTIMDKTDYNKFMIVITSEDPRKSFEVSNLPNNDYLIEDLLDNADNKIKKAFYVLGRTGDTIVHINGEKTNPVPMEAFINGNKYIDKCVIFGEKRMFTSILIQLNERGHKESMVDVLESIYDTISVCNTKSPKHSCIFNDLVYILPYLTNKKIVTTDKGSIKRQNTEKLFFNEINNIYQKLENPKTPSMKSIGGEDIDSSKEDIAYILRTKVSKLLNKKINDNEDLFVGGLDSLTSVQLKNYINKTFNKISVKVSDIYEKKTISNMADFLYLLMNFEDTLPVKDVMFYQNSIEFMLNKYTINNETFNSTIPRVYKTNSKKNRSILITGANGSLGSFLINSTLENMNVGKIYALVRANDDMEAANKIEEAFKERKLHLNKQKIHPLCYNSIRHDPEGENKTYNKMISELDYIYQVAWRMDFLKDVEGFEDNIKDTVDLLKIATKCRKRCGFNFISTVGATLPFFSYTGNESDIDIPEYDFEFKINNIEFCNGYNLSKMTTEKICQKWCTKFLIPLDIHRVGQVSGDTINGVWNTREHVSTLIKSAQVMEMTPEGVFEEGLTWIPVDVAADAIHEISVSSTSDHDCTISHIVNPKSYNWSIVTEYLKSIGWKFEIASNKKFIETLKTNPEFQNPKTNPIASLTDFFDVVLSNNSNQSFKLSTTSTQKRSKSIKYCPSVNNDLMQKYIKYWESIKFVN